MYVWCRYKSTKSWRSGSKYDIQENYEIKLNDVKCTRGEWGSCTYSESHNCNHWEDVFLHCQGWSVWWRIFIRKILNFGFIFGGQNGENLVKNGMRKHCFFQCFFGTLKIRQNPNVHKTHWKKIGGTLTHIECVLIAHWRTLKHIENLRKQMKQKRSPRGVPHRVWATVR